MHNYMVFLRKEVMELLRAKRLLGLGAVFLFFAFTSPLLARYMVEFLTHIVPAEEMLHVLIPAPVWMDSYGQFYSNLAQIGNLTIILMFMGAIAGERKQGTADLLLTKGLGYTNFVLTKFTVAAAAIFITALASILIVYFYTGMLFDTAGVAGDVLLGALVYVLFMTLILAITLFCSVLTKSNVIAALFAFVGLILISTIRSLPGLGSGLLPGNLSNRTMEITVGYYHGDILGNVLFTIGLIAVFLTLSIVVLKRQEGE